MRIVRRADRILLPECGFTLAEAVDYYKRASKWLLPHLRNRPLSFKRYPDTIRGESFREMDAPSFTSAIWVEPVVRVEAEFVERTGGGKLRHTSFRRLVTGDR